MKMTFQPKKRQRSKVHGFRARMSTKGGRKVLAARRLKGWFMKYSESLKKNRDFQLVYKSGTSKANRYLVMYVRENQLEKNRVGISVSKKVGNSVVRHHLARLIRESYRLNEEKFKCGYDIVIVVRVNGKNQGFHSIESALMHLGKLTKTIKSEENENDTN